MPTIPRLFVEAALHAGAVVAATANQAHYLTHVLRCAADSPVHVFNGQDGEWDARLALPRKHQAILEIVSRRRAQTPEPDLWLAFAPLKRDATDWAVQKATELGAAALLPVTTARTTAGRINEDRMRAIAIEAAEQSDRLTIPAIQPLRRLDQMLGDWPTDRHMYVAAERRAAPPLRPAAAPAALLIGPEGGFTPGELDVLAGCPFVTLVSLGPRILRAETACLAGLTLLQAPGCG